MKSFLLLLAMIIVSVIFTGCGEESSSNNTTTISVGVTVKSQDGALLNQATVKAGSLLTTTNEDGEARVNVNPSNSEIVLQVTQAGFINQAVVATVADDVNIEVIMLPVKEKILVQNIQNAQEINSSTLFAKVTLPENSLVDAQGQVAEGNVTLDLTPWDIQNSDIVAMLGNGQALDANSQRTELISAGMLSVSFYDAQGNYLQLAEGKRAEIQMDLPYDSINNIELAIGSEIPLWHFDEDQGLWIEEGVGTVVASQTSPVGLAVQAEVSHFSTWNWDFKFENSGSVNVRCQNSDNTPTPCNVVAEVELDDGSQFTKSNYVPLEGFTVINMPSSATIVWNAKNNNLIGRTTSGTTGDVLISLQAPTTNNFVKCNIAGQGTPCSGTLEVAGNDPTTFSVSAAGAKVQTALENPTSLTWNARSSDLIEGNKIVYYIGTSTSNASESVDINLSTRIEKGSIANTILVGCVSGETDLQVSSCNIDVSLNYSESAFASFENVVVGSFVAVTLPDNLEANDEITIYADDGQDFSSGFERRNYGDLGDGEQVVLYMYIPR